MSTATDRQAQALTEHSENEQMVTKVAGTELAIYSERAVVQELVTRLMRIHPAAAEVVWTSPIIG